MANTKLINLIRKRGGSMTVRDLMRANGQYKTKEVAAAALQAVVAMGKGEWKTRTFKGRKSQAVFLTGEAPGGDFSVIERKEDMCLTYCGERWMSADEIVKDLGLDMAIWQIDRVETKGYEVTGKLNGGQEYNETTEQLQWMPQTLWKSKNRYIAVRLVRRAPKAIQDGIKALLSRATWPKTPNPRRSKPGACVMELSLYDLHLGKYCWGKITNESYDNDLATRVFLNAANDLLQKTQQHDIDKIIIPVGHDFFQVDNWLGETTAGTRVDSCDDRFSKTFQVGVDAFRHCINECLQVAPVELIYVPGNHDKSTAFYLCKVLEGYYDSNKHVGVDVRHLTGHKGRKYRKFGCTLLGYVHGASRDCPKDRDLPLLMATERPEAWAATVDRAWRLGHLHTKRTAIVPVGDIFNGVRVERIPSLSATDLWHYDNGFTGNRRAAEAWIWSYTDGLQAQLPSYAKDS